MHKTLTDRFLRSLKPALRGKRTTVLDAAAPNFGIRITDRGIISFFLQKRLPGRTTPSRITLGRYPDMSLADGRKAAQVVLRDVVAGIHPKEREREQRRQQAAQQANTFAALAEEFIRRHVSKTKTKVFYAQVIRRELISRWGDKPVADITRADIIRMVEDIGEHSISAARQTLAYCRKLFNWLIARDLLTASPCDRVSAKDLVGLVPPRERVLTDAELHKLWQATEPTDPAGENILIRLLLVLGARRGEVVRMRWSEIDLKARTWHLSAERTKAGTERLIPLPQMAIDLLRALPERAHGDYLFSFSGGVRPLSDYSGLKNRLDRRIGKGAKAWRLHDLRRSMRSHLSALPISGEVAELMIGHGLRGVRKVYDRHRYSAEQRHGFELWCQRLRGIVQPAAGNVVPMVAHATR